jgi:hypothetical protein
MTAILLPRVDEIMVYYATEKTVDMDSKSSVEEKCAFRVTFMWTT